MDQPYLIKSKKKLPVQIIVLVFGGIIFSGSSVVFASNAFNDIFLQIIPLFASVFFAALSIACICGLFMLDVIVVKQHMVEIRSIFGKVKKEIDRNDISYWFEVERKSKNGKWKELRLFSGTGRLVSVSSRMMKNYEHLREELTRNIPESTEAREEWYRQLNKRVSFMLIAFGIMLIAMCYNIFQNANKKIDPAGLTNVTGQLYATPETTKTSKGAHSIKIYFKDFMPFKFFVDDKAFGKASDIKGFIANTKRNDTISVAILTDDYEKKLTRIKPLSFFDKTIEFRTINIYGLHDRTHDYLTVSDLNVDTQDRLPLWFIFIMGFVIVVLGIVRLTRSGSWLN